jgi:hypothetical protein
MNELPLSLDRFVPDSNVEADHDGDGKPERDHHSHDRHVLVGVNELEGINIDSLKSDLHGKGVYIQHTLVVTLHEMETKDYHFAFNKTQHLWWAAAVYFLYWIYCSKDKI